MLPYRKDLLNTSRTLRKNMTPEERHLWYDFLKQLPISVKRQMRIESYIVDFYIPKFKLVIELDGSQHSLPKNKEADKKRDSILNQWGITVLRFENVDVNYRFEYVKKTILDFIDV